MLGYGIIIPVLPGIFTDPNSSSYIFSSAVSVKTGYILFGILTALYPFGQFIGTPILGQLSDRLGRKPILAVSLFGTAIGHALFAIGVMIGSVPLLFFSRFLDGVTGGNISVAQAAIADTTTLENRAKRFGMIGVAFGVGFIAGPFLGGVLADTSLVSWFTTTTPFLFAAFLAFLNAVLLLIFLPETNMNRTSGRIDLRRSIKNIVTAYTMPRVSGVFITTFLFTLGFNFFTSFISVFLMHRFGFAEQEIGKFFAYIGVCSIIAQGLVVRRLGARFKAENIVFFALLGAGMIVSLFVLPTQWRWIGLIVPFYSIMTGSLFAFLPMLVSKLAPGRDQGELLGINASVQAIGGAIPALFSGFVASLFTPATPILVGAVILIFASFVFDQLVRKQMLSI